MYKKDIQNLLDSVYRYSTIFGIKLNSGDISYNWKMIIDVFCHLRGYLIDNGSRKFKTYLRSFNAVKWWHNKSKYHLTTSLQEKRMELIMDSLKDSVFRKENK